MEIPNMTESPYYYYYENDYINIMEVSFFRIYRVIQILSIVCYSIIILLGLAGNSLVIWISGFKMKTVSSVWFLNLATADFISCIFLNLRLVQRILELFSIYPFSCGLNVAALFTNMVTSVHFLILISLDRCISVMWPLWAKIHRTRRLVSVLSGFMWLLSIVIFFLQVVFRVELFSVSECYFYFYIADRIRYRISENALFIVRNICIFALPFLTIFVSYGLILLRLKRLRRRRSPRPFMIIAAILLSFFVCWFPYHTWALISLIKHPNWKTDLIITEIFTILACFNCAVNPILYVFLSKGFKKNFVKSIPNRVELILNDLGDCNDRCDRTDINNRTDALNTSV